MADTVIRFRCTEEEKAEVQRLADKLAGGNVSGLLRQLLQKAREDSMKKLYYAEYETNDPIDCWIASGFDKDAVIVKAAAEWQHLTEAERARRTVTVMAYDVPEDMETAEDAEAWMTARDQWSAGGEEIFTLGK